MMKMKETNPQLARRFNRSARYIDDLLTINNDGLMKKYMNDMYPAELELTHENSKNDKTASYLELQPDVLNGEITSSLYDTSERWSINTKTSKKQKRITTRREALYFPRSLFT